MAFSLFKKRDNPNTSIGDLPPPDFPDINSQELPNLPPMPDEEMPTIPKMSEGLPPLPNDLPPLPAEFMEFDKGNVSTEDLQMPPIPTRLPPLPEIKEGEESEEDNSQYKDWEPYTEEQIEEPSPNDFGFNEERKSIPNSNIEMPEKPVGYKSEWLAPAEPEEREEQEPVKPKKELFGGKKPEIKIEIKPEVKPEIKPQIKPKIVPLEPTEIRRPRHVTVYAELSNYKKIIRELKNIQKINEDSMDSMLSFSNSDQNTLKFLEEGSKMLEYLHKKIVYADKKLFEGD